jgi:hypothetical protein
MRDRRTLARRANIASPQISGEKSPGTEKPARSKSKSSPRVSGREAGSLSDVPLTPGDMLYLQRTVGNRAVNRLVQAKLKIGQPGDEYESEADQVAERVMRMPEEEEMTGMAEEEERKRPEESNMLQMMPEAAPAPTPVQHQQMLEDGRRKRQEDVGMVQMKEASGSGSPQHQAMAEEEKRKRTEMAEEEKRKRPEDAGMVQMKEASGSPPGQAMNPKDE